MPIKVRTTGTSPSPSPRRYCRFFVQNAGAGRGTGSCGWTDIRDGGGDSCAGPGQTGIPPGGASGNSSVGGCAVVCPAESGAERASWQCSHRVAVSGFSWPQRGQGFILLPRALYHLDAALLQGPPDPPAYAVRGPQLVSEPRDRRDVEHLDQREAGQHVRVGAGDVHQEAQAAVADNVELEEVAGPGQSVAQAQDDEEQRQVEQQLVERGGLAAHAVLHDGPRQSAGQAEGITAQEVPDAPDGLCQRQPKGEDVASGVCDALQALRQQHAGVAPKEAAGPRLATIPQVRQGFDEGRPPPEDQPSPFGPGQSARQSAACDTPAPPGGR